MNHAHHPERLGDGHDGTGAADVPGGPERSCHARHEAHAGRDKHAGHSVEMFWGMLVLSIPAVVWAPMIQQWFGYTAPGDAVASPWIPAAFGTFVFL
jgi:P-type Cu2+ transporter